MAPAPVPSFGNALSDAEATHLGPEARYSTGEQLLAAGGAGFVGAFLGERLDLDDVGARAAFTTVNNAFQSNVREVIDNAPGTEGFDDFGSDVLDSFKGVGVGLVGVELAESSGFDGDSFGDQLGSVVSEQAFAAGVDALAGSGLDLADDAGNIFSNGFSATAFSSLGAGLVASELTGELGLGAETASGAMLSGVGSTVGAAVGSVIPVVGTYIGSFIGSALGSAIGDLFGSDPPPPPEAEATLAVDDDGRYFVDLATGANGGNAGGMSVAAQRAADAINALVDATGGRLLDPGSLAGATIGYDGEGLYADGERFDSVAAAVEHIVQAKLAGQAIEGGDVFVKRALYRELEAGELDLADANDALTTARAYSRQQGHAAELERPRG
ncbi:MAG: hypothetical protein U5K43_08320 [Halofilum sp. (in: g-proteobacteria)]|nr:hypothetical protein [Halofilum sp. (in: g-proteobacteria)]